MSGRLTVVGIGPGALDQLTRAAENALGEAEVVVGYRAYLDRLPASLAPGRREAHELGDERERARQAVSLAAGGSRVALVSSGDAGVYGMASLAVEELCRWSGDRPELAVVPGVTAASAAAALLGAPLAVDFACVSLSDLLVPRSEITARVDALAAADIVLALYNPASRSRRETWEMAVASIQRQRGATTPVAAVRRAFRDGQRVTISDVGGMGLLEVDMETIVIVGSSRTRRDGDWLITLRENDR